MTSQHFISGALLLAVRQTEAQRGTLLAHHGRHPAALRPTPSRQNALRSLARHRAKRRNRYVCAVRVAFQRQPGWYPGYGFPSDVDAFKFV
jgi:hypothetical protein